MIRAALLAMMAALMIAPTAHARPLRGSTPWSIILCKFSDQPGEPHTPAWYQSWLTESGAGGGGIADYWHSVSYGQINLAGSTVHGWYTMPFKLADEKLKKRGTKIQGCVDAAAAAGYTVPAGDRTMTIINDEADGGSSGGRVILDPPASYNSFAEHEMGHSYGMNHSWSNDLSYRNAPWSQLGEYDDPWDIMGAAFTHPSPYGASGPGSNAFGLDRLGWLPTSRVLTFGANGLVSTTVTLAALERPSTAGYLLVRVPFDAANLYHYYTVELRLKEGNSAGIPGATVLLHEVKDTTHTVLLRDIKAAGHPAMTNLSDILHQVSVTVNWLNASTGQASVTITGRIAAAGGTHGNPARSVYGPLTCQTGYVWREADDRDYVCVTPATRAETRTENGLAAARRSPTGGAYGPDTCRPGYKWRGAFPADHVCVVPASTARAAGDNAAAPSRLAKP